MKIAMTHVDLPNESKGGVAHQVHYLANVLADRGHDVTMFTCSPAYAECHYRVQQYPAWSRLRRFQTFTFAVRLARTDFSDFDVLHTNGDNYLLRHPHLRTFYGSAKDEARSAVRLRRRLYQSVIAYLEVVGARRADINTGISEATRAQVPEISEIVPCGVDIGRFQPGLKTEHPTILFVGTTGGRKRGQLLAQAFAREIRSRFPTAELWAVAEKPMIGQGIVNMGRVPLATLTKLYQQAWVFCLPSTYEGFGVPYIEAMASGTAVVASPNPGSIEVLANGQFGMIASDEHLGWKISILLGNTDQREQYVLKGLQRAEAYAWPTIAAQYERLYEKLINASSESQSVQPCHT